MTLGLPAIGAPATAPSIAYYETAGNVVIGSKPGPTAPGRTAAGPVVTVAFDAMGRRIELELVPNDRLVSTLRTRLDLPDDAITIYRGSMPSMPGSWARLSVRDGSVGGVVWDGQELLVIDAAGNLPGPVRTGHAPHELLVIRASDIYFVIDESPGQPAGAGSFKAPLSSVLDQFAALAAPSRAVSLGVVLDAAFTGTFVDPIPMVLDRINIADGIFSEQADIHIHLEQIVTYPAEPDPFTSTDPAALLEELAALKGSRAELTPLGLAHLLTRLDLDGEVVGIASLRSVCEPSRSVGLTEVRARAMDGLIIAHEIAHNLGAPHDAEPDSRCQSTPPNFLMSATFNGSSELSQCSLAEIESVLRGASCLTPVLAGDITLSARTRPPPEIYYREEIAAEYLVNNAGLESTFDSRFEITSNGNAAFTIRRASNRECELPAPEPLQSCELGNMYGGETVSVDLRILPQAVGPLRIEALASASNDMDAGNNLHAVEVTVLPATDVFADGINNSDINVRPGESVEFTALASNTGDFDTSVTTLLGTAEGRLLTTAPGCSHIDDQHIECDLGIVRAGESGEMVFEATAAETPLGIDEFAVGHVAFHANPSTHDINAGNNFVEFMFVVWGAFRNLQTGFVTAPESVVVGESGEFVAFAGNGGPDPIASVSFEASIEPALALGEVASGRGPCTVTDRQFIACELGRLEAGERVEVNFPFTGEQAGTYTVQLGPQALGGYELDGSTATAIARFDVIGAPEPPPPPIDPPPAAGQGSGGGSASHLAFGLALWLLLAMLTGRAQRQTHRVRGNRR